MDAQDALKTVNRLYSRLLNRRTRVAKEASYYRGEQPLNFATEEWRKANKERYASFSDNWVAPVANAELERIEHTGLKLDETEYGGAAKKLWEQWQINEMAMQSSSGFLASLNHSISYVLVWPGEEDGEVDITWETPSQVEVEYDWFNPRKRVAAIKSWQDDKHEFVNLYTADEVWKFERKRGLRAYEGDSQAKQAAPSSFTSGGWQPRDVPGEPWPLTNYMGEVPIVPMPNRPVLGEDPISEIRGAMAMQDAINLLWAYLFLAADYASMEARVVLGSGPPTIPILNDAGEIIGSRPVDLGELREKRIMYIPNGDAKIDSWPAAQLEPFTEVIEMAIGHICAQSRTPPSYLLTRRGMSNVNGEGLKASEIGLVKKVIEFERVITPHLREVYRLIGLAKDDKKLADAARLATIRWADPEIRSEAQLADMLLKKKAIGYPLEYLMELDGLDPTTIERVLAMAEQEQQVEQAKTLVEGALNAASNTDAGASAAA
ncbi:phage portal protein [Canibacter oris]|uniref:Phage portal protein n=1 Tax=Canibacter oris TaxID=1365628 RepID=A0A840DSF1_9MICO|nr:phage portal protein [Canibacter oris]MBB4072056.1 hypothetical protein [Canibacter oris]